MENVENSNNVYRSFFGGWLHVEKAGGARRFIRGAGAGGAGRKTRDERLRDRAGTF